MEKIKNFNEFVNSETLNENTFEIEDKMLLEMASIGNIDNTLCVVIRMNDAGNIPHFHIMDKSTLGKKFHTCVKIETPEYFHHTGKVDVLNSKQRKSLVEFLKSSHRNGTKWEMLVDLWNINNSTIKVDDNIDMPDYTNIR
jgi:hypothetical protein